MNSKQLIIQEIEAVPEPVLAEVLDFLRFLKYKQQRQLTEDEADLAEAEAALEAAQGEETISWQALKTEVGLS